MSDIVAVQRKISKLDVAPQFDSYSKVIIHVSDETTYEYGTDTGRTLEIDNPFGTQQMCQDILQRLQGYQYQPYTADETLLDPAAEMGDALSSPLVYGGIYSRSKTFGRLMKTDVTAPTDEEINHEYKYESPETREFKRQIDDVTAKLEIANDNINAKVSQTGGDNSSFGWTLTASGFSLFSGNREVLKCDSSGLTVSGNIAGTSGTIGGFTISASALYTNNMSSMSSTQSTGVHLSSSGIKLGQNFRVDSSGNLTCNNATITGTLSVGGTTITAAQLAQGAASAYANSGTWSGTSSYVSSNGSAWTTGAGYGTDYHNNFRYNSTLGAMEYYGGNTLYAQYIASNLGYRGRIYITDANGGNGHYSSLYYRTTTVCTGGYLDYQTYGSFTAWTFYPYTTSLTYVAAT